MRYAFRPLAYLSSALGALLFAAVAAPALAVTIQAPGAITGPGNPLTISAETTSAGTTGDGHNPTLTIPGSYHYGRDFNDFGTLTPLPSPYDDADFVDVFVFTVSGSAASSVTTTIDLGSTLRIDNLLERLYSATTGETIPVLGDPASCPGPSCFVGTTLPLGSSGEVALLESVLLAPGTYVLEIRGAVTGTVGGSYAGVLNLAPVPLPAAGWFLLSGLFGLLPALGRRRRGAAAV